MEIIERDRSYLADLKPLWEELNSHHGKLSKNFKEQFKSLTFEKRISMLSDKKDLSVFLASDSGKYIGYCIATAEGSKGELDSIYIEPNYRKQKVGTKLMERALDWFDKLNIHEMDIYIAEGNEQVFNFYEKFGFKNRFTIFHKQKA